MCQRRDWWAESETDNDPFISIFELNFCRLLYRLWAGLGLECGILVGHLGAIDLSQSRGDGAATVQIGQKSGRGRRRRSVDG